MFLAAQYGHADVVEALVGSKADVNLSPDGKGQTPLHVAASKKRKGVIAKLLELGADKELKDSDGRVAKDVAKGDAAELL